MLSRLSDLRTSTALLFALSFALALPAGAQSATCSNSLGMAHFNAAHQVTLQGSIKEIVAKPSAAPLGLHMMVASTTGTQDVHLGSYLPKNVTENLLHDNAQVIVVGSYVNVAGKNVLLARQLVVAGQTVSIRNEHGFLIHTKPANSNHHAPAARVYGGAQ
jgi:hypothetical protein